MNLAATASSLWKSPVRSSVSSASLPSSAPRSPHTPSLPGADPRSPRFRYGGRERNFLAVVLRRAAQALAFGSALLAGPMKPAAADGAIIYAADQQASLALGAQMALADKVRQLQINVVGGNGSFSRLDGTATPLGAWYSGISRHYFDYIVANTGSSNFSISISTGIGIDSRLQTIAISSYEIHPTLDFVILQHAEAVAGASLPVFGSATVDQTVTFVGFGNDQFFLNPTGFNDGRVNAYNMRLTKLNDPTNIRFSNAFALGIAGGALPNDSSSPGYNPAGELSFFMQNATVSAMNQTASAGALSFVASGLSEYIPQQTPLNYAVPEPASGVFFGGAVLVLALSRRHRRN